MAEVKPLRAVGYWLNGVRPRRAPKGGWDPTTRDRMLAYLLSGRVLRSWLRRSFRCPFGCDFRPGFLPEDDLTDGEWVWPLALAHDVAEHDVRLPPEFLATAEAHSWSIPNELPVSELRVRAASGYDWSAWQEWYRQHRRPWYAMW